MIGKSLYRIMSGTLVLYQDLLLKNLNSGYGEN